MEKPQAADLVDQSLATLGSIESSALRDAPHDPAKELDATEDDDGVDDADEDEPPELDPFIVSAEPAIDAVLVGEELANRRAAARALAMSGIQQIGLAEVGGPGTLVEALNELHRNGLAAAEYLEAEDAIRFTPLEPATEDPAPSP